MIKITGDTHNDHGRIAYIASQLSPDDTVIICGDAGFLIVDDRDNNRFLDDIAESPYTFLFVDGNHENFDVLGSFPTELWNGGKVHKLRHNVIHLMRGQVFEIEGKKFFTFGGGFSMDKDEIGRIEHDNWWSEEMPSDEEYAEGLLNLERHNFAVDYIITHTAPMLSVSLLGFRPLLGEASLTSYLEEEIAARVTYKHWYFGHFHVDRKVPHRQQTAVSLEIIEVE